MEIRTFHAKQPHYTTDGFGRDSYITHNNGGLFNRQCRQANRGTTSLSPHSPTMRTPNIRIPNYQPNGSGRDSYITTSGGGFYTNKNQSNGDCFKASLRDSPNRRRFGETDFFSRANTTWVYPKNRRLNSMRASA